MKRIFILVSESAVLFNIQDHNHDLTEACSHIFIFGVMNEVLYSDKD